MKVHRLKAGLAVGLLAWTGLHAAAAAKCQVEKLADLPVTMAGLRPLVPAKINGHDVMLTTDSGAFYSTISNAKASELKLELLPLPFGFNVSGVAGYADTSATRVDNFDLAGILLKRKEFFVTALPTDAGAGLLGQDVLGIADVEYDLAHGAIRLLKTRGCEGVSLAYWAGDKPYSVVRIQSPDERNKHTKSEAQVNGRRITVMFDTGAPTTVISRQAAASAGVKVGDPGVVPVGISGGVGGATTQVWRASFASFKLGNEEVRNIKLYISDRLLDTDMLVGADFFISHRILVSNNQQKLYVTYEGGPIFSSTAEARERDADGKNEHKVEASLSAEAEPTDAAGYSRRGMAALTRNERDSALKDLNKAVELAPLEPRYLVERARIHAAVRQIFLAMADLDAALKLKPDDVDALMTRAAMKISGNDKDSALADLDAASRALAKEADARLALGGLYQRIDKPDLAIMQMDLWIASHPDNAQLGTAMNLRCWSSGLLSVNLDKAMHDCDRAVRLLTKQTAPLDSRGLMHLRRQEWQAAVDDYTAALSLNPKLAWSLYGRGFALTKLGKADEGAADIKAAFALAPKLNEQVKRYNLGL